MYGNNISCHESVLTRGSKCCHDLFYDMPHCKTLDLSSIDINLLRKIILYFYTDQFTMDDQSMLATLSACSYLQIYMLNTRCVQYLDDHQTCAKSLELYQWASQNNSPVVKNTVIQFMCKNLQHYNNFVFFCHFPFYEFYQMLTSGNGHICEEALLRCIMAWLKHNSRTVCDAEFRMLWTLLQFDQLPVHVLLGIKESGMLYGYRKYINGALWSQLNQEKQSQLVMFGKDNLVS